LDFHAVLWWKEKNTESALNNTENALNNVSEHGVTQIE
jgi:hypothetical protein